MVRTLIYCLLIACVIACQKSPLDRILKESPVAVTSVLATPAVYEPQIIYVQIDRQEDNTPLFRTYGRNVDQDRYFYPASTVKFPVAVMSMEKLNDLDIPGLDIRARMQTDSVRPPQSRVLLDSTSETGVPSIGHYVRKIFVVSDNDAYNRLYEFMGWDGIQEALRSKGLGHTRIIHRLSDPRFGPEENRYTNPVSFFDHDTLVYAQDEQIARDTVRFRPRGEFKGAAYIDNAGERIDEPFDFSMKNFFPLPDQVQLLKAVMFPDAVAPQHRIRLSEEDYRFLYRAMSMLPRESDFPLYPEDEYHDNHVKFLIYGDRDEPIPGHVRIFNKVGWAYGYLTDCAYVVDFEQNIEFILAATVHVNANNTYNDGLYEFEEVGLPFLGELGRQVYAFELERKRPRTPDLSRLIFTRTHD